MNPKHFFSKAVFPKNCKQIFFDYTYLNLLDKSVILKRINKPISMLCRWVQTTNSIWISVKWSIHVKILFLHLDFAFYFSYAFPIYSNFKLINIQETFKHWNKIRIGIKRLNFQHASIYPWDIHNDVLLWWCEEYFRK